MKTFAMLFAAALPALIIAHTRFANVASANEASESTASPFAAEAEPFTLEEGTARAEMGVKAGERFAIVLPGGKWSLIEFDSTFIGFVSRETKGAGKGAGDTGETRFEFNPFRKGTGILLFKGREEETTVVVHIEEAAVPLSSAREPVRGPEPPQAPMAEPKSGEPETPLASAAQAPSAAPKAKKPPSVRDVPAPAVPAAPTAKKPPSVKDVPAPAAPAAPAEPKGSRPRGAEKAPQTGGAGAKQDETAGERGGKEAGTPEGGMFYTDRQNRVVDLSYRDEEEAYRRGSQLYQKGQAEKALDAFLGYLAECKKCVHEEEARYRAADLYAKQGMYGEALGHLEPLLRSGSQETRRRAYLMRADIDLRSGNVKRAIEGYSAAWKIDDRHKELPRKIADLYFETKDYDLALPLYERVVEGGNADDEVYFRAASICESLGKTRDIEKAYKYYKTLVERFKGSPHAEYARERVRFLEKNFYNFK